MLCLCAWAPLTLIAQTEVIQRQALDKSFEDVIFDLEFAITQRNFRITARNFIGRSIRERGVKEFPRAQVIHFCNLTLAREALEIDPLFLIHMPCRVAVYDHGDRVTISTSTVPEKPHSRMSEFSMRINRMLRAILRFAAQ
jgi:uncharacterized protein (DUF302 family)